MKFKLNRNKALLYLIFGLGIALVIIDFLIKGIENKPVEFQSFDREKYEIYGGRLVEKTSPSPLIGTDVVINNWYDQMSEYENSYKWYNELKREINTNEDEQFFYLNRVSKVDGIIYVTIENEDKTIKYVGTILNDNIKITKEK